MSYGFTVVTINQASRRPQDVIDYVLDRDEADAVAQRMREETAAVGRRERHVVCELVPVEDES